MKILLIPNLTKEVSNEVLTLTKQWITSLGHSFVVDESQGTRTPLESQFDLVMTIGGDGTFLRGARIAYNLDIPVIGVNTGNKGALTEIGKENYEVGIKQVLEKDVDENLIHCTALEYDLPGGESGVVVNDIACTILGSVANFTLKDQNDQDIFSTKSSGLIVATTIGSTGYSLSSGGPRIEKELDVFVVTPIAACEEEKNSLVIHSQNCYKLSCDKEYYVSLDGEETLKIPENTVILLKKAEHQLKYKY